MRIVRNHLSNKTSRLKRERKKQDLADERESKYDDQELRAMQRSPLRHKHSGNLFCILTRQLFWQNLSR